jgi:hypothetical protein
MAQVFFNGMTNGGSGSSRKIWWWICGICFAIFILMMSLDIANDGDTYEDCLEKDSVVECESREFGDNTDDVFAIPGMTSCCFSLLAGIIAFSHGSGKPTVILQQMPQMYTPQPVVQQVIQQVIQQPVQQRPQGQMPLQQPPQRQTPPPQSTVNIAQQAKDLEMARDFVGAAEMYQKAGLFAEAGRVRQSHLEKDETPMVQIGQVGNSVVKDSVVMDNASQSNMCHNCGSSTQAVWKFCPKCNSPI